VCNFAAGLATRSNFGRMKSLVKSLLKLNTRVKSLPRFSLDSRADSTVTQYCGEFLRRDRFIAMLGSRSIPAHPVEVALYLTNLLDNNMTYHSFPVLCMVYNGRMK
jgi:hypothetical protein